MSASRAVLARIEAAAMVRLRLSPLTMDCCGIARSFSRRASIRRCWGVSERPSTAPRDGVQDGLRARARIGSQGRFRRAVERVGFDDNTAANLGEQKARHARYLAEIGSITPAPVRCRRQHAAGEARQSRRADAPW